MDEEKIRLLGIKEEADDISGGLVGIKQKVSDIGSSIGFPSPIGQAKLSQSVEKLNSAIRNIQTHTEYLPFSR